MEIFTITGSFPKEEVFSLTSQIRRSSRSISANLAEAFEKGGMKRHLLPNFQIPKLKASETQVCWIIL
jgi:four helix bundle protein